VFEYKDMPSSMPVEELRYVLENLAEELNGMEVEYMMNMVCVWSGDVSHPAAPLAHVWMPTGLQADPSQSGHLTFDKLLELVNPPYRFDPDQFPDPRHSAHHR